MIRFPTTVDEAAALAGERRAGGVDVTERRKTGRSGGDVVDLRDVAGLDAILEVPGGLRIGAGVPIATLAADRRAPSGLAAAAGGLATPQIRAVGTVGGNLYQHVRCWYYRNPQFTCLKSGGSTCPARAGDHAWHNCFDDAPCAAPHPSTLACALLACDGRVELHGVAEPVPIGEALARTELAVAVFVPSPWAGERAAYFRTISRARAEWPIVEATARLRLDGDVIADARVAIGGVASRPLRREAVEQALIGRSPTPAVLEAAAALATDGSKPLPMTGWKVPLVAATVLEALERAVAT